MATFADMWSPVSGALANGTFDPVGANNWTAPAVQSIPAADNSKYQGASYFQNLDLGFINSANRAGSSLLDSYAGGLPAGFGTPGYAVNQLGTWTGILPDDTGAGMSKNAVNSALGTAANWTSAINDYFVRGVVIVLGFIFVAVGLALFKPALTVQAVKSVTK